MEVFKSKENTKTIENCVYIETKPEKEDLEEILEWLRNETMNNGDGFYNNRSMIERAFQSNNIVVLKLKSKCIGLAVLSRNTFYVDLNIFVIKPSYRVNGYGRTFYNKLTAYLVENGYFAIKLFCAPPISELFWKKIGFTRIPDGVPCSHELTYYDIIRDTAFSSNINGSDKIELWDIDFYSTEKKEPRWVWYVESKDNENTYPIVHPCNCNWKIRISRNGKILRENKVKYITDVCMEFYNSPFLVFFGCID